MASLYEISTAYLDALENLEVDENGEINLLPLEEVNAELNTKLENIALYIKNCDAMAKSIKEEEANLAARRKAYENKAEHLKDYLSSCMQFVGASKFETAKVKLSFRASESVEITNQNEIPKDFLVEKVTVAPDKAAIKAAIKNGILIPGAEIVRKENLQIK